jgi:hypothetical protein
MARYDEAKQICENAKSDATMVAFNILVLG